MRLFPKLGEYNKTVAISLPFDLILKNQLALPVVRSLVSTTAPRISMKKIIIKGQLVSFNSYKKALIAYPNRNFTFLD
jgi:hypothetical protein